MDFFKRVLAWIGVILLVGMYVMTLVTAVTATDSAHNWFMASIAATILVPVVLYAYNMIYNVVKMNAEQTRLREEKMLREFKEELKQKAQEKQQAEAADKQAEVAQAADTAKAGQTVMQTANTEEK